ncbi:MAG: hypothetical protein JWM98_1335, partial [Thermoleophilia bacterium]|nr:hypothetical protein [Thermoleophilia bacterium]
TSGSAPPSPGKLAGVKQLSHKVFVQQRHNWLLLVRFGIVGASGVVVNLVVLKLVELLGPDYEKVWIDLPATDFNVRWYHPFVTIAFLAANLWNFQLNRAWTFQSAKHASWLREYVAFLAVGLLSLLLTLGIVTVLLHPGSPVELSTDVFDGTNALRNRLTWSNLIAIAIVTPASFLFNKLWTFRAVRGQAGGRGA